MENILEQLIADFHERPLPGLTKRRVRLPWLPRKADTVIGMRRVGKTWFLYQVMLELMAQGAPKEALLYLNLEDERLLPLTVSDLHLITDVYYRRYPGMRDRECYFFFDEIQNVAGWESFVRRLLDTEDAHICLTGSSAKLLSRDLATSLRGRSLRTEMFPFSFSEALEHAGIEVGAVSRPGAKKRSLLENKFRDYLLAGGFPEIQGIGVEHRVRVLQEYLDVVILRDVVERHKITNTIALRYMIRHLLNSAANLFSVNKFYNDLRSQGISCGKQTLHEYLDYLTDAYLFFSVPMHSRSERARMVNPRKIYAVDTGLIIACSHRPSPDWGHLLENFVFLELRRRDHLIEYYRTAQGHEVDFLATDRNGKEALIQVSLETDDPKTRQRELRALEAAMAERGLKEATIVSLNSRERVKTKAGLVNVVPASIPGAIFANGEGVESIG